MRFNRFPAVVVYLTIAMAASTGLEVSRSGAKRNLAGPATGPTSPLMLWYPSPAERWTDGVAIGNGRLGAMVFCQPEKDRLQLNDITVWSGGPAPDADRPEGYKALPEIRRLLREEKFPEAERLMQQNMLQQGDYFPSYQTLGDLNLSFTLPEGSITDYQRWLDVSRALAGVAFKLNGDTYTREVFSSAPAGVIVMNEGGLRVLPGYARAG